MSAVLISRKRNNENNLVINGKGDIHICKLRYQLGFFSVIYFQYIHTHTHIYIYIYIYIYICIYVCACEYACVRVCVCMYVCMCECVLIFSRNSTQYPR